mgnify:CR=1 FL=1
MGNADAALEIVGIYGARKAVGGTVCKSDGFFLGVKGSNTAHRPEYLFLIYGHIGSYIGKQSHRNVIALCKHRVGVVLAAADQPRALLLALLYIAPYLCGMGLGNEGIQVGVKIESIARNILLSDKLFHFLYKLIVDAALYKHTGT